MENTYRNISRFGAILFVSFLVMIILSAWLLGVRMVYPVSAEPGDLYVDGASGVDQPACGTDLSPCKTISYTLNTHAAGGDTIRVAQGVYTENLTVNISVTLEGGYEATGWTRDIALYETVIDGSGSAIFEGDWDGGRVRYPMILSEGSGYQMWYNGYDLYDVSRIGYATSADGIHWTKHPANPVLDLGSPGAWDADRLEAPFVIQEAPDAYKMWYSAWPGCAIGYATSSDGFTWNKYPDNPVLTPGSASWNNNCAIHPFVLYEAGTYKMWLLTLGDDGSSQSSYLAYATSSDGITWNWDDANPVLSTDWETSIWRPDVFNNGSGYDLWYSAWIGEGLTTYASSPDGLAWSKHGSPVLSGTPGEWDDGRAVDPFVLFASGTYTMYYDNNNVMGLATSSDGIIWNKSASNPLFFPGTPGQWGAPVVRFNPGSNGAVLDGFTITGSDGGGGVWIEGTDVSVLNDTVTGNNNQMDWGGGIHVRDGANALIVDSVISGNLSGSAGGLGVINNATVTLENSFVEGNSTTWGAGGGIGLWFGSNLTVNDSLVRNNATLSRGGGIHVSDSATASLTNALIYGNSAYGLGAGIDIGIHPGTSVAAMNITVVDNFCATDDGCTTGIRNEGTLTLTNSIVVKNDTLNLNCDVGTCNVTYSNVHDSLWPGVGNISAMAWFVNTGSGDYHVQAWSPTIDSGTTSGAPDHDLDGNTRPLNSGFDMGAYEFTGTPIINVGTRYVATTGSDAGPNLCLDSGTPCQTITNALGFANSGESILVAEGTYLENLDIRQPVSLFGGYESTGWTRDLDQYETKLDGSGSPTIPGDWDGQTIVKPSVLLDGATYMMWYDGFNLQQDVSIGLATSADGITWMKSINNPVLTENPGGWDGNSTEHGSFVLKEDGLYKMWYEGSSDYDVRQLGYATSTDGITWNKYGGNPVLQAGPEGYDQHVAGHGSVLHEGNEYKLWYHATGDQGAIIAYATSPDGITWTKQGPVLLPTAGWDEFVWGPSVLNLNGTYWMWYSGAGSLLSPSIGVATSPDGINWTRLPDPVVTGETGLGDPHVITDTGVLKMWYTDYDNRVIDYAESVDGIHWTKSPNNPVLTPGVAGQWGGSVVTIEDSASGSLLDGFTITGGSDGFGGGVYASNPDVTIRNCLITGNYASGAPSNQGGGGVLEHGEGTLTIENSRIVGNQVDQGAGGVRVHGGTLVLTNTLIADNHGDPGIHVNGPLSVMNITVADNDGGIVFNPPENMSMQMVNSIVYNNGWTIGTQPGAITDVTYSDVEGSWPGIGNIDAPPEFVAPLAGDYHLLGSSPAVDAGTPAGAPPSDLEGTPRDSHPDLGAYEYQRFDNDMAVVDALPGGKIAVGVAVPVRATLFNTGLQTQSNVPVTCQVTQGGSTLYNQTLNSGTLLPLTWQVLTFPTFTPASQGNFTLICTSNLVGDENTTNDAFSRALNALAQIADVWTKDNPQDNGDVPSDLDGWYESPDLWVRNTDDGGLTHQDPIAGVTNYIYVRLRNRGTVAITGSVDVYWIEPSLGVRCGDWAYIDTVSFSDLLPGEVRILSLEWVPTRTGHTCLQDVIDSPDDPYNRALECSPLWVPWDNNVEWHNVNIIDNPSGRLHGALDILQSDVNLVNVYNLPKEVDLIVERETFPVDSTITVQLPDQVFDRWLANPQGWGEGIEVLTGTREIRVTGEVSATIGAIPLQAAEKAVVNLAFDGPAGLAFETTFRERIDGLTVGGVTYQWVIPDTTPPSVLQVTPAAAQVGVPMDAPLVITFDEPVSPINFNLMVSGDPGGWQFYWNDDSTVVTATHASFSPSTTYSVSVTAQDAAANPMPQAYQWSFTTAEAKIYLPLVIR